MWKLWEGQNQVLTKFDTAFIQETDPLLFDIDNNINITLDSKMLLSREKNQHHIISLSKGKEPRPDFLRNEHIMFCCDDIHRMNDHL